MIANNLEKKLYYKFKKKSNSYWLVMYVDTLTVVFLKRQLLYFEMGNILMTIYCQPQKNILI